MCNKSGIALNQKLINGANLIDSDYKLEIHAHMINYSKYNQSIVAGQKITQGIIIEHHNPKIKIVSEFKNLDNYDRKGGFGSTTIL